MAGKKTPSNKSTEPPVTKTEMVNYIDPIFEELKNDIHYSTVSTLSRRDVESLRTKLVEEIQNYVQTVSQSKEETMYCFNLDFFKLLNE